MVVIVYGYEGSGPGHWQRWLADELQRRACPVSFPELPDPTAPQREGWVAALATQVAAAPEPVTLVAHSLGCWAVDHLLAARGAQGIHAALLVAPPSPFLLFEAVESFFPPPRQATAWAPIARRSLLVGSDNDDFASAEELEDVARTIGISCTILPGAGHLNLSSGYGPWPFVLEWLHSVGAL